MATLYAQDPEPVSELAATASAFVAAFNEKDSDAISKLFSEDAEMFDEIDGTSLSGREEIEGHFADVFADFPSRAVALEVSSVRLLTNDVAIENGTAHFSDTADESFGSAIAYTATLVRLEEGWRIASSRELRELATGSDLLDSLSWLVGNWTLRQDEVSTDLSFRWDRDGQFLIGTAEVRSSDGDPLATEIRIGHDRSSDQIRWWTFDSDGGFATGNWFPHEDGWLVRTRGVTAEGEKNSAVQILNYDGENTINWRSTHRYLNGEPLPDLEMYIAKQPPAPGVANLEEDQTPDAKP